MLKRPLFLLCLALGVPTLASAGDGGQDETESSLRCFTDSHLEVRFSLDPKSRLAVQKPMARYIAYSGGERLYVKGLTLTTAAVTDKAITATLASGGEKQIAVTLPVSSATSVLSEGGDCYRVHIEKLTGTLTLFHPIPTLNGSLPAGTASVTCLLERQFESGCE